MHCCNSFLKICLVTTVHSSGSKGGGQRNMKYKPQRSTPTFMTIFYRPGGHGRGRYWFITAEMNGIQLYTSSGSRNFGEGGPRNLKYKPPHDGEPSFFGLFFTGRGGGGMAPLAPPPWIRYWYTD